MSFRKLPEGVVRVEPPRVEEVRRGWRRTILAEFDPHTPHAYVDVKEETLKESIVRKKELTGGVQALATVIVGIVADQSVYSDEIAMNVRKFSEQVHEKEAQALYNVQASIRPTAPELQLMRLQAS